MISVSSPCINRLIERLASELSEKKEYPLEERWILLPHSSSKQWLLPKLVKVLPLQSISGVKFKGWQEVFSSLSKKSLREKTSLVQSLDTPIHLYSLLKGQKGGELFEWMEGFSQRRLGYSAQKIAKALQQLSWQSFDLEKLCEQAALWKRELLVQLCQKGPWRFHAHEINRAPVSEIPGEIHCFLLDELPRPCWEWLQRFSARGNLFVYSFSPSFKKEEEGFFNSHPFLGNFGKLHREQEAIQEDVFQQRSVHLEEKGEIHNKHKERSFLSAFQQDLLFGRTTSVSLQVDSSLELVFAGGSIVREVELLKERIIRYLAQQRNTNNPCSLSDLLVLAPDIRLYESAIHFVFQLVLPYQIEPIDLYSSSCFLQGVSRLLNLVEGNWEVSEVLSLFENASFQTKRGILSEDFSWIQKCIERAEIREGRGSKRGSWQDGLTRMIRSLVYCFPEKQGFVSVEGIDWNEEDRIEQLLSIFLELEKRVSFFSEIQERSCAEWADLIEEFVFAFFSRKEPHVEEFTSFLFRSRASSSQDVPIPFSFFHSLYKEAIGSASSQFNGHLHEAIRFTSLEPGSLFPARAIFVLGMDEESFPRIKDPSIFDFKPPRISPVNRDRHLFVQTLFCAQEHLSFSFCHLGIDGGKEREPSFLIQEWLCFLDLLYPLQKGSVSSSLIQKQRTLPFTGGELDKPLSLDLFSLKKLREPPPFSTISLREFTTLASHPWKFFLQKNWGVYLKKDSSPVEKRRPDFCLLEYEKQTLLAKGLKKPIESLLEEQIEQSRFPLGGFGKWYKEELSSRSKESVAAISQWGLNPKELITLQLRPGCTRIRQLEDYLYEAPPLLFARGEIVGEISHLSSEGLVIPTDDTFSSLIKYWPMLIVASHFPQLCPKVAFCSVKSQKKREMISFDPARSLELWLDYYFFAMSSCSPLLPAWAEVFLRKDQKAWESATKAPPFSLSYQDPIIEWIWERTSPFPAEKLWDEWAVLLKRVFADLIEAFPTKRRADANI